MKTSKVILVVMDGYGLREADDNNAIALASAPNLSRIFHDYPTVTLKTSGLDVGLPAGQMGNSEVGHLNLGAGRVVYQDITRIDHAIETGEFYKSPVLLSLLDDLNKRGTWLHLMGLVSNGGVHSSLDHLRAILEICRQQNFERVLIHAFTDGRDTPPHSGLGFVRQLDEWIAEFKLGRIQTVSGRYYAMDRDKRWDRVQKAYDAICSGQGNHASTAEAAVEASYAQNVTDEFIIPTVIDTPGGVRPINADDGVFFFNFRADRARQLTDALAISSFSAFPTPVKVSRFVTMTRYREEYPFPVVSPPQTLVHILGEELSKHGMKQLRIAETEKYPHVTFFFNGGEEKPFDGEDRILVPSPKVATYDLQPQMSAPEVTDKLCEAIISEKYGFILVNYANCDMVGHTGFLKAAIQAVETVDSCISKVWEAGRASGYSMLLTADHGNAEEMWDASTNGPHTAHTTDPVPLTLASDHAEWTLKDGGRLADIAPTIIEITGLSKPPEMTGQSLLVR